MPEKPPQVEISACFLVFLQPESKCYHSEKLNRAEMKGDCVFACHLTKHVIVQFLISKNHHNRRWKDFIHGRFPLAFSQRFFQFFSWSPITRNRLRSSIKGDWTGCYSTQSPEESTRSAMGPKVWSSVPSNVKKASTLSSFKYNIRKVDLSMLLDDNNCSNCSLCTS